MAARFPAPRPTREETLYFQRVFGVGPNQILHDFIVSHVLDLLRMHKDELLFAGGTAAVDATRLKQTVLISDSVHCSVL